MDDEIICGWPVLFDNSIDKIILFGCYREDRIRAAVRVCDATESRIMYMPDANNFYKLDGKKKEIYNYSIRLVQLISQVINEVDFIYTHNSYGEYFHSDHILIHNIVKYNFSIDKYASNIYYERNKWINTGHMAIDRTNDTISLNVAKYNTLNSYYGRVWRTPPNASARIDKI